MLTVLFGALVLGASAGGRVLPAEPEGRAWISVRAWPPEVSQAYCAAVAGALSLTRPLTAADGCDAVELGTGGAGLEPGSYELSVSLNQSPDGALLLRIEAWTEGALDGADHLVWSIPAAAPLEQSRRIHTLLLRALADPGRPPRVAALAPLVDTRDAWMEATPPEVGATVAELGSALAVGALWYGATTELQGKDWEYPDAWSSVQAKVFSLRGYGWDDNPLHLNSPGHPLAGAVYYLSARDHRFGVLGAFAAASAATVGWEYLPEFREVVSLNDLILTPVGGLTLGESMYQLSLFFERSEDTPTHRLLATVFGGPSRLSPLGSRRPAALRVLDSRGLTTLGWHRLALGLGMIATSPRDTGRVTSGASLSFSSELMLQESYARPGTTDALVIGPVATRLSGSLEVGLAGVREGSLRSESVYSAYVVRNLAGVRHQDGADTRGLFGSEGHLGLSALFEHDERELATGWDRVATGTPIGVDGHFAFYLGDWSLRANLTAHPVFSAIQSLAYDGTAGAPDVLREQGYFYGFGGRMGATLEARTRHFELGASARALTVAGVEDAGLSETRTVVSGWIGAQLPSELRLRASLERTYRSSDAYGPAEDYDDTRIETRLGWEF